MVVAAEEVVDEEEGEGAEETRGVKAEVVVPQEAVPHQADKLIIVLGVNPSHTHDTRHPDMLISHQYSHVSGTGLMASQLTFVWSRPPARGRTSGSPNQTNEILTASAKTSFLSQNLFMTWYTVTKNKK